MGCRNVPLYANVKIASANEYMACIVCACVRVRACVCACTAVCMNACASGWVCVYSPYAGDLCAGKCIWQL